MLNAGMVCLLLALGTPAPDAASLGLELPKLALVPALDEWGDPARLASLGTAFPGISLQSSLQRPSQTLRGTQDDDWGWVAAGTLGGVLLGFPVGAVVTAGHAAPGVAAGAALTSTVVGGVAGYFLGDLARHGSLFAKVCVVTLDVAVSVTLLAILPLTLGQPNSRSVGQRVGA